MNSLTYLSTESFASIPPELVPDLQRMLSSNESFRPTALDFTGNTIWNSNLIDTFSFSFKGTCGDVSCNVEYLILYMNWKIERISQIMWLWWNLIWDLNCLFILIMLCVGMLNARSFTIHFIWWKAMVKYLGCSILHYLIFLQVPHFSERTQGCVLFAFLTTCL